MKYGFIQSHSREFPVPAMCQAFDVHRSGFYAWLKNPLSRRAGEDQRQTGLIKQSWLVSGCVYGYRKVHDDLDTVRALVTRVTETPFCRHRQTADWPRSRCWSYSSTSKSTLNRSRQRPTN